MPVGYTDPRNSGLTQSYDDARRGQNQSQGYNPDAIQRILDWIGRQFGGGRSSGPSGGSRAIDWIGRQLGGGDPYRIGGSKNPVVTDPYARGPAQDAWFRSLENSPTPFGNVQYGPPAPARKPVTKLSSADAITKKINTMVGPPQPPPPVGPGDFGLTGYGPDSVSNPDFTSGPRGILGGPPPPPPQVAQGPWVHDEAGGSPLQNSRVDMRTPPPPPGPGPYPPEINTGPPPPKDPSALDSYLEWRNSIGRPSASSNAPVTAGSPFGVPDWLKWAMPQLRAEGGPVGLMRGGYPELFGATKMPVRHTFDSGGESFVGSNYSNTSGREDDVNAKLSAKEYVVDAETMAMLGDGNPDHGAKKMDEMRAAVRRHKGQALAKGKFSPKAKSAQEYLVGNPMGDGLRRRGRERG